jgi:hypothetical protein
VAISLISEDIVGIGRRLVLKEFFGLDVQYIISGRVAFRNPRDSSGHTPNLATAYRHRDGPGIRVRSVAMT